MIGLAQRTNSSTAVANERRVVLQRAPLIGVLDERQYGAGGGCGAGGVEPTREQQPGLGDNLFPGQRLAVQLAGEQLAQKVVPRLFAQLRDELGEVAEHLHTRSGSVPPGSAGHG